MLAVCVLSLLLPCILAKHATTINPYMPNHPTGCQFMYEEHNYRIEDASQDNIPDWYGPGCTDATSSTTSTTTTTTTTPKPTCKDNKAVIDKEKFSSVEFLLRLGPGQYTVDWTTAVSPRHLANCTVKVALVQDNMDPVVTEVLHPSKNKDDLRAFILSGVCGPTSTQKVTLWVTLIKLNLVFGGFSETKSNYIIRLRDVPPCTETRGWGLFLPVLATCLLLAGLATIALIYWRKRQAKEREDDVEYYKQEDVEDYKYGDEEDSKYEGEDDYKSENEEDYKYNGEEDYSYKDDEDYNRNSEEDYKYDDEEDYLSSRGSPSLPPTSYTSSDRSRGRSRSR